MILEDPTVWFSSMSAQGGHHNGTNRWEHTLCGDYDTTSTADMNRAVWKVAERYRLNAPGVTWPREFRLYLDYNGPLLAQRVVHSSGADLFVTTEIPTWL